MSLIFWPVSFSPDTVEADINWRTTSGSTALDGSSQVLESAAALWQITFADLGVFSEHIKLVRTLNLLCEGRKNSLVVPVWEGDRIPRYPDDGLQPEDFWQSNGPYGRIPHSDGAFFSDGAGYYQPTLNASLGAPVARGATVARIDMGGSVAPEPGNLFSIGNRLYGIREIRGQTGNTFEVSFRPRAREAAAAGDPVEFDRPCCKVRLASDTELSLPIKAGQHGLITVRFVEDLS